MWAGITTILCNIVDDRTRKHRWANVDAVIEATWHDNKNGDSDQAPVVNDSTYVLYEDRLGISVEEAVTWAVAASCPVTLFLYDGGSLRGGEGEDSEG